MNNGTSSDARRVANPAIDSHGSPKGVGSWTDQVVRDLDRLDRAAYRAVANASLPGLDRALARLSNAADHSKLWFTFAGVLAAVGGRRGRLAATDGLLSVGMASAVANIAVKAAFRRRRPDRVDASVPQARWVVVPSSTSFPSGHTASAFAFASAIGSAYPPLWLPLHTAAAAVAYSRVHTGVHYPGDTIAGCVIGVASAATVRRALRRYRRGQR